jgi:recombination protein U
MSYANRGKGWEQLLEMYHARYEATGRAVVIRTPPNMRIIRSIRGGQFVAVYEKEGPPDYLLLTEGLAVMVEAKEAKGDRWPLQNLKPHQAMRMSAWRKQGGEAAVVLRHHKSNTAWVLPWGKLKPVWDGWFARRKLGKKAISGTASLDLSAISRLGVPFGNDGYLEILKKSLSGTSKKEEGRLENQRQERKKTI